MKKIFDFLTKQGQTGALLLGVVVIVIILAQVFLGIGNEGYELSTDLNEILKADNDQSFDFFNGAIILPIVLVFIIIASLIFFGIVGVFKFPKEALFGIGGLVVLLLLFGIFYATSTTETTGKVVEVMQKFDVGDGASKAISAGIKTTLVLVGASILAILAGETRNAFK